MRSLWVRTFAAAGPFHLRLDTPPPKNIYIYICGFRFSCWFAPENPRAWGGVIPTGLVEFGSVSAGGLDVVCSFFPLRTPNRRGLSFLRNLGIHRCFLKPEGSFSRTKGMVYVIPPFSAENQQAWDQRLVSPFKMAFSKCDSWALVR